MEGNFRFGRVEKLRHVDLISNHNVGNVYTDIKVYNTPSFWFNSNEIRKHSRYISVEKKKKKKNILRPFWSIKPT
jgi:hypothetical protein